jgi:hypothetical protein
MAAEILVEKKTGRKRFLAFDRISIGRMHKWSNPEQVENHKL